MERVRYDWIDRWRGILIFLVVLGHVVGGVTHFAIGDTQILMRQTYKFIYSFHMPAFFVLAGITFHGVREGWGKFIVRKARRLLVPYFAFGVASLVLFVVVMSRFAAATAGASDGYYAQKESLTIADFILGLLHGGGWPNGEGLRFNSVLWFLPCMFACEMIYVALEHWIHGWWSLPWVVFFFVLHYVVCAFVPITLPWGLARAFGFMPYMIFGHLVCRKEPVAFFRASRWSKVLLMAIFPLLWTLVMDIPYNYWYESGWWMFVSPFITLLGVVWSAAIAQTVNWSLFSWMGVSSMGIMLMHKFPVMALQFDCSFLRLAMRSNIIVALCLSLLLSILVVTLCGFLHLMIRKCAPWTIGG